MRSAHVRMLGLWLGASLTLASGCGASVASDLDGRVFLLDSSKGFEPVSGTTVRLSFHDGHLGVDGGCNSQDAEYKIDDGRLIVSGFSSTEIGCDPELHDQDRALADFMSAGPQLKLSGPRLTLTGKQVELVFLDREVADPDRPLEGRVWTVDTFIDRDSASNFPGASEATIEFRKGGELHVNTTCNTGTGRFSVSGDQITLADVGYTKKGCTGTSASIHDSVVAVMSAGTLEFKIQASRLTLMRGELGLGAHAP